MLALALKKENLKLDMLNVNNNHMGYHYPLQLWNKQMRNID